MTPILRTILTIFIASIISMAWIILIFNLNLPNYATHLTRMHTVGIDGLSNSTHPTVLDFAGKVKESEGSPEEFIHENITYALDMQTWGVLDYWETPEEVIEKGQTDCEGFSILIKSVSDILKNGESEIKRQPGHAYVVRFERMPNGDNQTLEIGKMGDEQLEEVESGGIVGTWRYMWGVLPDYRRVMLVCGLVMVWGVGGTMIRK